MRAGTRCLRLAASAAAGRTTRVRRAIAIARTTSRTVPRSVPSGRHRGVIYYEPHARDRDLLPHDPFKALVVPRPIGWVSTIGASGDVNLAPYSFFNAIGEGPAMLAFSSSGCKDSATFAGEVSEFVWNLATWDLREAMNQTSAALPRGESEFAHAGLEMAPSRLVAPPRVAATPCAMECKVVHSVELRDVDGDPAEQFL